jgi:hypothetical protein
MRNLNIARSVVLSLTLLISLSDSHAQSNKGEAAALAVGAIAAIGAAAIEVHLFLEMLETQALNHVMAAHPEMESFRLKVLDLDGKKMSDIGAMSVLTFRITQLDKQTGEEQQRSVLMMFTSNGWMNQNGIDFRFVSWKMLSRDEWNDMFVSFVQLNTPVKVDRDILGYPKSEKIKSKNYNPKDSLHYCLQDDCYEIIPGMLQSIVQSDFTRKGMSALTVDSYGYPVEALTLPFFVLKNDDYLVADYSDEFKLFANEKSMGLFLKNTNESLQLQRTLVSKIHTFLNRRPVRSW